MRFILSVCRAAVLSASAVIATASLSLAQTQIDLAIFHAKSSPWTPTIEWWIDEVAKVTEGRVKIVPHYSGALSTLNETYGSVRTNAVPAGLISAAAVSGQLPFMIYPEVISGLPMDLKDQLAAMGELRPIFEENFREKGVEHLWSQTSGSLLSLCRRNHLKEPTDWQGVRIRTAGRWQGEQVQLLGAAPVAIDPSEQYIALQNGTIDCVLSVAAIAAPMKLYEVAPKVTALRQANNLALYIVNKGVFDGLSPKDQAAIREVSVEAERRSAEAMADADEAALEAMAAAGADAYRVTDEEKAALAEIFRGVFTKIDAEAGEAGQQVKAVVDAHR